MLHVLWQNCSTNFYIVTTQKVKWKWDYFVFVMCVQGFGGKKAGLSEKQSKIYYHRRQNKRSNSSHLVLIYVSDVFTDFKLNIFLVQFFVTCWLNTRFWGRRFDLSKQQYFLIVINSFFFFLDCINFEIIIPGYVLVCFGHLVFSTIEKTSA